MEVRSDVNPVYTKYIVGYDKEESDYLLNFLYNHIATRQDFSCRVRYEAGTVLVWDQRVTNHSQTLDYPVGGQETCVPADPAREQAHPRAGGGG
jgi:sulfonate dioxygenase